MCLGHHVPDAVNMKYGVVNLRVIERVLMVLMRGSSLFGVGVAAMPE